MSKTKFEQVLNRFLRQDNFDVYVTGNIPEFAGRGDEIHIMPLVFLNLYKLMVMIRHFNSYQSNKNSSYFFIS